MRTEPQHPVPDAPDYTGLCQPATGGIWLKHQWSLCAPVKCDRCGVAIPVDPQKKGLPLNGKSA